MTSITLNDSILTIANAAYPITIDLRTALCARMWDRPVTRYYMVREFVVRGVYPFGDGLKVHLVNEKEGLYIPLIIKPTADGFRASVPAGQIVEQYGMNRKLMELSLFPDLMQSATSDEGFFLLPDYCGTLVRFSGHEPTINRDRIYMDQTEWEKLNLMNCFAVNRAGRGVLAMVHSGDFNCCVTTELNQKGVNRIYPTFILRTSEGKVIKQEDKEVIYACSAGREAEYPRMAMRYRDYFVNERGVSPLKERVKDNPVLAYSTTAMRTKIFMGCKRPSRPDGSGEYVSMTTFAEAEQILDAMQAAGFKRAVITLVGWNLGGHDGYYPTRFPIEPQAGGMPGLKRLIEKAKGMGYQIVPHDNYTDIYRSSPDWDPEFVARTPEGEMRVVGVWSGGQSYKSCPTVYMDRWGGEVDRIREIGFTGHYYCDAQSPVLWDCHDPRHPADEEQFAISLAKLTQIFRAQYGAVSTEIASAFSVPFVDEVAAIHAPDMDEWVVTCMPESFRKMIDRIVPFYQIALHGLVTYQMSWVHQFRNRPGGVKKGLLRMLAYGARPCMEVMFDEKSKEHYIESIRDLEEGYRRAFVDMPDVHVETMQDYEELAPEAARITYANGTVVTVNWGDAPAAGLAALSYSVTRR